MMLKVKDLEFLRNLLVDKQEDLRVARDNVVTTNRDFTDVDLSCRTLEFIQFLVEKELRCADALRAYQPPPAMLSPFFASSGITADSFGSVEGPFSVEGKNGAHDANSTQNHINVTGTKTSVETICSNCSEKNPDHTHCMHTFDPLREGVDDVANKEDVDSPIDLSNFIIKSK